MIQGERVETRKSLESFVNLDYALYEAEPRYVPPIRYDVRKRLRRWMAPQRGAPKHEAALFLARDGDHAVGRIAASIDHTKNNSGARVGSFGFLEGDDDPVVFARLFDMAEGWLAERGVARVLGPYSFTQEDPYVGLLIEGFDLEPSFGMTWSHPYYPRHVEAAGYGTAMDLRSYFCESEGDIPEAIVARGGEALARADVRIRPLDMSHLWDEARLMRNVFNAALADNWEFVPFTDDQVRGMVEELRLLADPRVILIAEVAGAPAGCIINIPDYNDVVRACRGRLFPTGLFRLLLAKRNRRRLRGYALGVLRDYRRLGIAAALLLETFRRGLTAGYRQAEVTWILGNNAPMNELAQQFAVGQGKVHRIYEKSLA